ncbi:MAG TPA: valine--tRNA ligase [Allosphingosinicella sp.]
MKRFPDEYDRFGNEEAMRRRWAEDDAFKWDSTLPAELDYVIDTPPPTVSGTLHVGHIYSYTQADIIARYMRMSGRNVLYPIGWDDNGLPTERLVEKVKKVRGGTMEREAFVALCREVIPDYEAQFRDLFSRLALSVDWSREYQTISDESRAISQLSFLDLYEKGLVERRLEPTLWDPADRTAIAQAEVDEIERDGALNRIVFRVNGGADAVIATSRPELIGACVALMIHPSHPRAAELRGRKATSPLFEVPVPIVEDLGVDPDKGTGMVMCCTFGDVTDIHWWRTHSLPLRLVIDKTGRMSGNLDIGSQDWPSLDPEAAKSTVASLAGLKVEQARAAILAMLDERGLLKGREVTRQVVPVAERSGAPLEIIVTPQWFIRTLDFKTEILAKGEEIVWRPSFMRQRFESWVEGLKWDWSISRQRHFGVPLPVWYSKRAGEEGRVILPSAAQLPVDPTVDLPEGYTAEEVEGERDVLDTWATSSVTPQMLTRTVNEKYGYDQTTHQRLFPMAMRPQAHEIIRTWAFYTIVKALHHQDSVPWRDICISGWCLAGDGSKMSKSKGNVIDPIRLLDEYGSDAVRYWTGTSRLGNDTVLAPNTLKQGKRLTTKLWNACRLAHLALAKGQVSPTTIRGDLDEGKIGHPLDRWLLGQLAETLQMATAAFESYEYAQALRLIEDFFWRTYCDNYLEFVKSRTRFEDVPSDDESSALYTLYHATDTLIRMFAPFLPFVSEVLFDIFSNDSAGFPRSVHQRGCWPRSADHAAANLDLEAGTLMVDIAAAVRRLKTELGVSLRAPISNLVVTPLEGASTQEFAETLDCILSDLRETTGAAAILVGEAPEAWPSSISPSESLRVAARFAEATV